MKSLLIVIHISFFLISYIYCKKLTCNEITNTTSVENKDFDVEFYLNDCDIIVRKHGDISNNYLKACNFRRYKKIIVIIHGFTKDHEEDWVLNMKAALQEYDSSINVIRVNWNNAFTSTDNLKKSCSKNNSTDIFGILNNSLKNGILKLISILAPNYRDAALSTEIVAEKINKVIQRIAKVSKVSFKKLHFIGHSLGAHVAGQAGRKLKAANITVQRVTGLDPAYPCFGPKAELRLNKTSAEFVDVIHSNSELGNNPNFGTHDMLGHIDFYPNGGNHQPGCDKESQTSIGWNLVEDLAAHYLSDKKFQTCLNKVLKINATSIINNFFESKYDMTCDHGKASEYFIKSLNRKNKMWAVPFKVKDKTLSVMRSQSCNNNKCVEMGMNAYLYKNNSGSYYIKMENEEDDISYFEIKF